MTNTEKKSIKGYNANKFVKYEHVFEEGVGCWCFSKNDAIENNNFTGNEVDCFFLERIINGYTFFIQQNGNVWD